MLCFALKALSLSCRKETIRITALATAQMMISDPELALIAAVEISSGVIILRSFF